jgi:hypothetical protein
MSHKSTIFSRKNKEYKVDFLSEEISSDISALLLEKIERKHKIIKDISSIIPDDRNASYIEHSYEKMLKQRVFFLMHGYEDANDANYLRYDPAFKTILDGEIVSQPTISRFENKLDKRTIFKVLELWVDKYVKSLQGRNRVVIDIDATDDPTYGSQQQSMFNGYYGQFMYNELFFHDGETGQVILPVLRPGNSHSNKWYVAILKRIIKRIYAKYHDIKIIIRADSGFSNAPFYKLADDYNLEYSVGLASNEVLKRKVKRAESAVRFLYAQNGIKHQHFISFKYQAKSWHKEQQCYSKIESTGMGMNVRHFVSNLPEQEAREIYFDFYVKRGDASENRIKEIKNMCFSDRLSDHKYWSNFIRLIISSIAYEMFLIIKTMIKKTKFEKAHKWQIDNIRLYLLKVGGTVRKSVKRIYFQFSKSFVHRELFEKLIFQ